MDASKFFAFLRFEEASLALRAVLRMGMIDDMGVDAWSKRELCSKLGFTDQACRTFLALLEVMDIVTAEGDGYRTTELAKSCLADGVSSSRRPYLAMGSGAEVDALIDLLRGKLQGDSIPLYGSDDIDRTVMDIPDVAREIAFGLASRARNFAEPLATAIVRHAGDAKALADIGAGSPYVAAACLKAMPQLQRATLVDRSNGMLYAREIARDAGIGEGVEFHEQDFFVSVPAADIYCVSNTAHDWNVEDYATIMKNIRAAMLPGGLVCLHEPIRVTSWGSTDEWLHALWMACYALCLFRLTQGHGTCYARDEHDGVMASCGFTAVGDPIKTADGCTALFYRLA
jgi:SAM-dependent methyltransferase